MRTKENLSKQRQVELEGMKKVVKQLKKSYPSQDGHIKIKFMAWFDTDNHRPGKWYLATTCFYTMFINPSFKKVLNKLLKNQNLDIKKVIVCRKDICIIKNNILKNKNLIKVM